MPQTLSERLDQLNALMLAGDATDDQVTEALRLVALADAAPAMLAALELCEDALSDLARMDDGTCSISALHAARDAIRRAGPVEKLDNATTGGADYA